MPQTKEEGERGAEDAWELHDGEARLWFFPPTLHGNMKVPMERDFSSTLINLWIWHHPTTSLLFSFSSALPPSTCVSCSIISGCFSDSEFLSRQNQEFLSFAEWCRMMSHRFTRVLEQLKKIEASSTSFSTDYLRNKEKEKPACLYCFYLLFIVWQVGTCMLEKACT